MKIKEVIKITLIALLCNYMSVSASKAQTNPQDFIIENNEVIKKEGNVIGRLEITKNNIKTTFRAKAIKYLVKVYDSNNELIAVYDVKSGIKKLGGHYQQIYEATLNTIKDRVLHTGSNFIDYNERKYENEDEALQVSKLVNYLSHYKYI